MPRGEARSEKRGKLAPTKGRGDVQRIVENGGVTRQPLIDHCLLAPKSLFIDAGAMTGKARSAAAEKSRRDSGGCRGIADAHLAQNHEIGVVWYRLVASSHRIEEFSLVHGGSVGKIYCGALEIEREHLQFGIGDARELIYGGPASGEIRHHLRRHFGG